MTAAITTLVALALTLGPPTAGDLEQAELEARQGLVAYQAGEPREAAAHFLTAYRLSHRSTPLRNAAKALEEAGDVREALVHWSVYATLKTLSPQERAEARARVRRLRGGLRPAPRAAPKPIPPPAAPPSKPAAAWAVVGGGVVLAGVGAALWLAGDRDLDELDARLGDTDAGGQIRGISPDNAQADLGAANRRRVSGITLVSVGAASAIAGALWWALSGTSDYGPAIAPTASGGALILWRGAL